MPSFGLLVTLGAADAALTLQPPVASVKDDGVYEGYVFIPAGGTNEFKLYAQPAWEPQSYGTLNDGVILGANYSGDNFIAPSDGYYFFSVDFKQPYLPAHQN